MANRSASNPSLLTRPRWIDNHRDHEQLSSPADRSHPPSRLYDSDSGTVTSARTAPHSAAGSKQYGHIQSPIGSAPLVLSIHSSAKAASLSRVVVLCLLPECESRFPLSLFCRFCAVRRGNGQSRMGWEGIGEGVVIAIDRPATATCPMATEPEPLHSPFIPAAADRRWQGRSHRRTLQTARPQGVRPWNRDRLLCFHQFDRLHSPEWQPRRTRATVHRI